MRRILGLLLVGVLVVAGACSGGDGDSTSDEGSATSDADAGTEPADDATGAADAVGTDACLELAEAAAGEHGDASFTDIPPTTWQVVSREIDDAGRAVVEVVPDPDEVGYPAFRFVSVCEDGEAVLLGAYALDGGTWLLLFTTGLPAADDLEPTID